MGLSNRNKILIIAIALILLLGLVVVALFTGVREAGSETRTVVNQYEGYQIVVPYEWNVKETGETYWLEISFGDGSYFDAAVLNIVTFDNPEELSITDWLKQSPDALRYQGSEFAQVQLGQYTSLKTTVEITDEESAGNPLRVTYLLKNESSIYAVSCIAYSDIDTLIPLCEKQVQTFTILNEDPLSEFFPYGGDGFEIDFNGADSNARGSTYRVVLKPTLRLSDDGFEKEIDAIVKRANDWITAKGVDPKSLSIEWVTE